MGVFCDSHVSVEFVSMVAYSLYVAFTFGEISEYRKPHFIGLKITIGPYVK